MRLTMFVFPVDLVEIAAAATRSISNKLTGRWIRDSAFTQDEFDSITDAVDAALQAGPLTVRSLRKVLGTPKDVDLAGVVARMCDTTRLVGGRSPGSWRSPIREYHRWSNVLPGVDVYRWEEEVAVAELIRRYIVSYGPVTVDDIVWWTGFTKARCREALAALGNDVEEVTVADWPGPLFRHADGIESADPEFDVKALPMLDPYVQGYKDRGRFLDPARTGFVYDGGGNSAATVVYRGRVIGVWQVTEDPVAAVRYHLFEGQPKSVRRAAEADLAAAGAMYFERGVDVGAVTEMQPLRAGGGRSAMHPLDDRIHRASRRARKGA